ncbi:hypothetical protein, partial [Solidesulfovibrio sp.]|uniref:hypothetical protein n=1 Tax=Solidesulfovibrio sp. TaxID=2910990 RepID=UPI002B1FA0A2
MIPSWTSPTGDRQAGGGLVVGGASGMYLRNFGQPAGRKAGQHVARKSANTGASGEAPHLKIIIYPGNPFWGCAMGGA